MENLLFLSNQMEALEKIIDFQEKSLNINKEDIIEKIKEFESLARRTI